MDKEIKNSLYSLLDLMDSLNSIEFLKVDVDKTNKIREIILSTINQKQEQDEASTSSQKSGEDIFIYIYNFLSSKKMFKKKDDLIEYADTKLKIKSSNKWKTKTINDIIGNIMVEIIKSKNEDMIKTITKDIQESNITKTSTKSKLNSKKEKNSKSSSKFMDTWFNYFDNYEG